MATLKPIYTTREQLLVRRSRRMRGTHIARLSGGGRNESRSTPGVHDTWLWMRGGTLSRGGDQPRDQLRGREGQELRQPRPSTQPHDRDRTDGAGGFWHPGAGHEGLVAPLMCPPGHVPLSLLH